jgi:hypothetical protein
MKYVNFWLSNEGQALLTKYGFGQTLSMITSPIWVAWIVEGAHCQLSHTPPRMPQDLV